MRDPNTALLEDLGFLFVNVHNMGGNDIVAEHAEMVEPAHRTHAVSFNAVLHFFFCFGHMQRQSLTVGFGRFGAVAKFDEKADWASEARRYYLNIVGKYGPQVQALLKKAAALDIQTICPLHGPVLTGDLSKYLAYYDMWSSYKAEEPEKVLVASASIHGHTREAAHLMAEKLRAKGAKVVEMDLTRTDVSYAVTEAFRCGKIVLACATYDGFLFPPMENLLAHLKTKNFQSRTVGLMENGTWAPMAAKLMRAELESMKNITVCENVVTIRSAANDAAKAQMDALADELVLK